MTKHTIGVDISKDKLDVHSLSERVSKQFSNTTAGYRSFVKWLSGRKVDLIVFEPTGPYHRFFEQAMNAASFPMAKVNPRYARSFAQALGILAKTDRVDAAMLARMGLALDLEPREPKSDELHILAELYTARRGLMKDRTALLNRQKNLHHPLLKRQCAARLRQVEKHVENIETELRNTVQANQQLKRRFDILISIPGISTTTALSLIIELPELGDMSSAQTASLAGLAPMNQESGNWKGKSRIRGGRARLRQSLYMPALVATRYNPDMRIVYDRLVGSGKPAKVAITAVMRKMVVLANTLIRAGRKWEPRISAPHS